MSGRIFGDQASLYWEAGYSPIPVSGKAPLVERWSSYCDNLPKPATRADWLAKFASANIGLALGKEVVEGFRFAAIDVDDPRFVGVTQILVGSEAPAKFGRRGRTLFVLLEKSKDTKSTAIKTSSGGHAIDLLVTGKQTVIPPSIHPETNEPYRWTSGSLLERRIEDLPRISCAQMDLLKAVIGSAEAEAVATGISTHDPGMRLAAQLVRFDERDEFLADIIASLFPVGYTGNSLEEIAGWVSSARAKGFANVAKVAPDEAAARKVADELHPLKFTLRDGFLHYDAGHWKAVPHNNVLRLLKATIGENLPPGRLVAPMLNAAEFCLRLNVEDDRFGLREGKICLRNGTLDLASGELLKHSPDHRLRFALDIEWDPAACAPIYEEQLHSTLKADPKAIATFEEFAGLTLVADQRFQKALFLMGPGGSGKSTLLRTLQMMHDPAAVSVTPLDKLEDERYRTDVAGKLVCISFDVQTNRKIFGETFIRITGGDAIAVRLLYKEVEGLVQPTVRFVGSMNPDMPPYQGAPDALRRRLLFLTCGDRIQQPDPERQAKIEAERTGILVRWVSALRRLNDRGKFDPPDSSLVEVDDYLISYEAFDTFAHERLAKSKTEFLAVSEVAGEFNVWADAHEDRRLSTSLVGRKLKRLGFELGQKRIKADDESTNTRVVYATRTRAQMMRTGRF